MDKTANLAIVVGKWSRNLQNSVKNCDMARDVLSQARLAEFRAKFVESMTIVGIVW
jgi:hypothetical protein